ISQVMHDVEDLLDESIAAEGYVIREPSEPYGTEHLVDLSKIDFEALKAHFQKSHKRIQAEQLKGAISIKLRRMVRLNRIRMNFLERLQQMIDEYNAGSINVDVFFDRLVELAKELSVEEKRSVAEQLTEEELAVFDLLAKPEISLTSKEERNVKRVARSLLETLKQEKLVLDWRKRQQSRAAVRLCIEETLDELPATYTKEIYVRKCDVVYQHVYDSYFGRGRSIYAEAA
ncbi:unnamed protein product, partial [marine sediment metagenome]